ncbi:MAG: hypothetical protein CL823_04930 [Crocinitomicaceae bacterium]|mgnify:CR=1 FL=1|nr:hypothetical protein [Crocinitomicaceae bacterium]
MRKLILALTVVCLVGLSAWMSVPRHIHSERELYHTRAFVSAYGGLPDTTNSMFTGSGKCAGCHATDPNFYASIAGQTYPAFPIPEGHDVNPTDMWRSSIMANSAKDPFWRAKVTHEVAVNPEHQAELEDKCTSCHAPLGHFAAHNDGLSHYTLEMLAMDSLALDGVSCVACHQQSLENSGVSFSGEMHFDSAIIYGPYGAGKDEPPIYDLPMLTYSNYLPIYGSHISESKICADCHTLVVNSVDLEGNYTGIQYVEQATYHEWINSAFSGLGVDLPEDAEDFEATCQSCHMPQIDDPVIISSGYAFLEPRTPYGLHQLAGANTAMLEIMRDNLSQLGLTASIEQFDSTLLWTQQMLTEKTIDLEVLSTSWNDVIFGEDAYEIVVQLKNKAGHKFPSGYPSRRAFVELLISNPVGDTIFHSGKIDASGARIINADENGLSGYEPHYDIISSEEQVQIYEVVDGDVTGNPTNIQERAAIKLKDNRIVPYGFSINHNVYDTTSIVGEALFDPNFNSIGEISGTGSDDIIYSIPSEYFGDDSNFNLTINVWYQSMPPKWVESMFDYQTPEIELFESLYENHGAAPILIASHFSSINLVDNVESIENKVIVNLFPSPTYSDFITLNWKNLEANSVYELYNSSGLRVGGGMLYEISGSQNIDLPFANGIYLIKIYQSDGIITRRFAKK